MPIEFRAVLVLIAMLTLPGWALLTLGDTWQRWKPLQRWCLAIGLSIAVYPVLFYAVRSVLPDETVGPVKLTLLLSACGGLILWRLRGHWRALVAFDRLEWLAVGLIGATLFTRFWIIRDQPYPAWSDSLHHVLLTHLTALQGRLPATMEPYFPIALGQYHLGLYALSGSVEMLSRAPAHTALLWTAQTLNGLCGLGVYLVLDRKVGPWAAVVGATVVGLLSFQPAWYVNWGRFTQVSGQTVLLIAWVATWHALTVYRQATVGRAEILWTIAAAAMLNGAVFLFHFRVAAFYLPLVGITVLWELWRAYRERRLAQTMIIVGAVGVGSLVVVLPALRAALSVYVASASRSAQIPQPAAEQGIQDYFTFPLATVPLLVARPWLLGAAGLSTVWGWVRRSKLTIAVSLWTVMLVGLGYTYLLKVPVLNITNLGAILIMLYIPIGLVIGIAAEEVLRVFRADWRTLALRVMAAGLVLMGVVTGRARALETEPYRYFVSSEDVMAMEWIKDHTSPNACFAINTYFWLPYAPHGTDAGYWIPYFTGRRTTAGSMLWPLAPRDYITWMEDASRAVERLTTDNSALAELRRLGIDYIYVGANGNFAGPGLAAPQLSLAEGARVVYHQDRVWIFEIAH